MTGKKKGQEDFQEFPQLPEEPFRQFTGQETGALPTISEAKRDRGYEERARKAGTVVTYRKMKPATIAAVAEIANHEEMLHGEAASFLLDYAIDAYRRGELVFPKHRRVVYNSKSNSPYSPDV